MKKRGLPEAGRVLRIPVEAIVPNPAQPRRVFDEEALGELAESIARYGILQPLSVRRVETGYELVAGERRLRAARLAGLAEVPCLLLALSNEDSSALALVENLQRQDLNFVEEAQGIAQLIREYGLSQEEAARRLGRSQSAIANKLRLLRLSPALLQGLRAAGLTERHARALLRLPTETLRQRALNEIARRELTVARTEELVTALLREEEGAGAARARRAAFVLKDARLFLNSVRRSLALAREAGVPAQCEEHETDDALTLTITVPKNREAGNRAQGTGLKADS